MDIRSLAGIRIAAIGEGTRKILEDRGLLTDLMPEIYDGDCLGETLAKELKGGERILIPRAKKEMRIWRGFLRRQAVWLTIFPPMKLFMKAAVSLT